MQINGIQREAVNAEEVHKNQRTKYKKMRPLICIAKKCRHIFAITGLKLAANRVIGRQRFINAAKHLRVHPTTVKQARLDKNRCTKTKYRCEPKLSCLKGCCAGIAWYRREQPPACPPRRQPLHGGGGEVIKVARNNFNSFGPHQAFGLKHAEHYINTGEQQNTGYNHCVARAPVRKKLH